MSLSKCMLGLGKFGKISTESGAEGKKKLFETIENLRITSYTKITLSKVVNNVFMISWPCLTQTNIPIPIKISCIH